MVTISGFVVVDDNSHSTLTCERCDEHWLFVSERHQHDDRWAKSIRAERHRTIKHVAELHDKRAHS